MTCKRSAHRNAALLCCLLATADVAATDRAAAQPEGDFEAAPVLAGAVIAPAALLKGPLHSVAEPVTLDGYFGRFVIESKVGVFAVAGVNLLGVRVNELQAIATLEDVEKSQAFQASLLRAASAPVRA
jgi:hypothetical protein